MTRIARLIRDNDALAARLEGLRARYADARDYLDSPGAHLPFGRAHLGRCRARMLGCLAELRANRLRAAELTGDMP